MRRLAIIAVSLASLLGLHAGAADEPVKVAPLAVGQHGVVVGTTGPLAVHAGLETLKAGGSAADAALATALCQIAECGGCYVSYSGILGMVYFDAATGQVHSLNAAYDTPREEKEPLTIPGRGKPSGRTALVPGFMAGVGAAHERFGKLPRAAVFAPAIGMAEKGFPLSPMVARMIETRKAVLSRLPETKRLFVKEDGAFLKAGDLFRQPDLAKTLKGVAAEGAAHMYTGAWAKECVAAVRKEGGKLSLEDLKEYKPIWEEPLRTEYRGRTLCLPGYSSQGGVAMAVALHLAELAELPKRGHHAQSAESLFWLMQIGNCQILSFLPEETLKSLAGLDLSHRNRATKASAASLWGKMREGSWPFGAKLKPAGETPGHSDGIVVVDRWGNVAAITHSINTTLWGDTALFVGGVSINDSASFQQDAIRRAGPGKRLPDPMCPLITLENGKPTLASSAIGGGLHQRTLQTLVGMFDFKMTAQAAVEEPAFLLPDFTTTPPTPQVEAGQFDAKLLAEVEKLGQKTKALAPAAAGGARGYWVAVEIDPKSGERRAVGTRKPPLPSVAEGY